MNWKIDQQALDRARQALGIEYPVKVRASDLGGKAGKYHGLLKWGPISDVQLDEPVHQISLSEYLSVSMANTAIWHELTHAAQCEDYLDDEGKDYRGATKGLRKAFGKEMREMRADKGLAKTKEVTASYGDVSFEVEARDVMDSKENFDIIKPIKKESSNKKSDGNKGYRHTWRVDMWTDDEKKFVGTAYVLADQEWDAKKWARDNYMQGMKWSNKVYAYPINPRGGE